MKKKIISTVFGLLASTGFSAEMHQCNSHQIYFGPEFLGVSVNAAIKTIHIEGHKNFAGLRLGYEYLKPRAFYAGIDLLSATSLHHYAASENEKFIYSSAQSMGFNNLDLRFGYAITPRDLLFAPFLGVGVYGLGTIAHNRGFHEGWAYLSAGLRSKFLINPIFNLGINLKLFKSFFAYEQFQNHITNVTIYSYPWGAEIGVPFVWSFNPKGTWTFQIEPYWIKLDFSETQNVLGSKFLIDVHF
jgi:hypothetical protein